MKVMIRRAETGLSIYVPKKDLEEPIVESELEVAVGRLDPHRQRLGSRIAGHGAGYETSHHDQCPQTRRGK